jgi:hypothetical protein
VKAVTGGLRAIHLDGATVHDARAADVRLRPAIEDDDEHGVDIGVGLVDLPQLLLGRTAGEPAGGEDHERRHGRCADRPSRPAPLVRVLPLAISDLALAELERACRPVRPA